MGERAAAAICRGSTDDAPPQTQRVAWWKSLVGMVVSGLLISWVFFAPEPRRPRGGGRRVQRRRSLWILLIAIMATWLLPAW